MKLNLINCDHICMLVIPSIMKMPHNSANVTRIRVAFQFLNLSTNVGFNLESVTLTIVSENMSLLLSSNPKELPPFSHRSGVKSVVASTDCAAPFEPTWLHSTTPIAPPPLVDLFEP
ncbi:hypothetical protein QVD17_02458 [Tagetes erecta]|uniref:Uncharacterized protein n=1 Tax=Tagetes erecta TaxID=13708 RepID=A0AAD8LCR3_TARER|nr:hypothetical protein QVD17_02458 [Tagetes erecta]